MSSCENYMNSMETLMVPNMINREAIISFRISHRVDLIGVVYRSFTKKNMILLDEQRSRRRSEKNLLNKP